MVRDGTLKVRFVKKSMRILHYRLFYAIEIRNSLSQHTFFLQHGVFLSQDGQIASNQVKKYDNYNNIYEHIRF